MSTLSPGQKTTIAVVLICLVLLVVGMQYMIDPARPTFRGGGGVPSVSEISVGLLGAVLSGFREVVAGLLWVKTDDYFHEGKYSAMVPLCYIIVFLDPHQIDVFSTGAWHFAYNFTDKNELSDRRFIPTAVSFLERGVTANPKVYDLYAELGWMYLDKIKNYQKAVEWFEKARQIPDHPAHVDRNLAHAYEKAGNVDKAVEVWKEVVAEAKRKFDTDPKNYALGVDYGVSKHNLDITLARQVMRKDLWKKPKQANLQVRWKKLKPRVLLVEGKINLPPATRLDVILKDKNYDEELQKSFAWRIDNSTMYFNSVQIREDGTFSVRVDMDANPQIYRLQSEEYELQVIFNTRAAAVQVQDLTGWNGEGFVDPKYQDDSLGYRRLVFRTTLKKSDIV
ncbi:MAG: hypothetical protein IT210_09870 [Armatimonadetes bacterium]|nr:hypothetical protein [Armatimonadota bacterium]